MAIQELVPTSGLWIRGADGPNLSPRVTCHFQLIARTQDPMILPDGCMDTDRIRKDFDEIARLADPGASGTDRYDEFLLSLVPVDARSILDVGFAAC